MRTLAIFYTPDDDRVSRDRLTRPGAAPFHLDALKLVVCVDAKDNSTFNLRPGAASVAGTDRLHPLLSILNPRNFLLHTNVVRSSRVCLFEGGFASLGWDHLRVVVRAGFGQVVWGSDFHNWDRPCLVIYDDRTGVQTQHALSSILDVFGTANARTIKV